MESAKTVVLLDKTFYDVPEMRERFPGEKVLTERYTGIAQRGDFNLVLVRKTRR